MKPGSKKKLKPKPVLLANITRTKYPIIRNILATNGWKFTESSMNNIIFWGDAEGTLDFTKSMEYYQFYNHFPGMWKIAHKVELVRIYDKMQLMLPNLYHFHPKSFIMPFQYADLRSYFGQLKTRREKTFIVKPDKGSQGKGIFIIQHASELSNYNESAVAQQYISPLLIDSFKFDLRIYVLVTSVDPLRIYIHNEGMARFCTEPYSTPTPYNVEHSFAHLTNFSLNKKSENYTSDSKRPLTLVFEQIKALGYDLTEMQNKIDQIIRLTLISNQPLLASNYHTSFGQGDGKSRLFEILGFDILLDDTGNPWLLELNSMPSLACGSPFDKELKHSVLEGTLKILDIQPNFKKKCLKVQRRMATLRMSGIGDEVPSLFHPERETEIAKTTNWRQIYPIDDEIVTKQCETALLHARITPSSAMYETAASRKRKELLTVPSSAPTPTQPPKSTPKVYPKARPKPIVKVESARPKTSDHQIRTPRSVHMANEARKQRIEAQKNQAPTYIREYPMNEQHKGSNIINDAEEKQRQQNIRKQVVASASIRLKQSIDLLLHGEESRADSKKKQSNQKFYVPNTMKVAVPYVSKKVNLNM